MVDVVDWSSTSEPFRNIIAANRVILQKADGSRPAIDIEARASLAKD